MTSKKKDRIILTGRVGEEHGQDLFPAQTGVSVMLVVAHAERNGKTRIISARRATRHERTIYENG